MTEPVVLPERIRALKSFRADARQVAVGEEIELAWAKAAHWIENGCAEPVFDLTPFRPPLPPEGCSLLEAFRRHVEADPNVAALSEALRWSWRGHRLYIARYREPPMWQTTWQGVTQRPRWRVIHPGIDMYGEALPAPRRPPPAPFVEQYNRACQAYFVDLAIRNFRQRLAREELDWDGVPEANASTLDRIAIPAGWLERDAVLDLAKGEFWEIVTRKPKRWERRFSDVRIKDVAAEHLGEADSVIGQEAESSGVGGSEAHDMIPEGGLALAEAYKSYVENDDEWEMRNAECDLWEPSWAQILRDEWPGCTMVKVPRHATGVAQLPSALCVPAEIEGRPTVREECWRCARMAWGWGEDPGEKPDDVPDEAVQVHARRRECEAQLIGHLRAGDLIAKAVREYPEPRADLEPENIGPGWWSRKDLLVGFAANALFRSLDDRPEPVLFFSNVRVFAAKEQGATSSTIGAETLCKEWLCDLANAGPPEKASEDYWQDARTKFGERLSRKAYERARAAAREINPVWGKAGQKYNKINH